MKKTPIKRTIKRDPLDILWSKFIKLRDGRCRYCGRVGDPRGMHAHHLVGRRYIRTRYEPDNGIYLCLDCHNIMTDFPKINLEFAIKCIGSEREEELEIQARSLKSTKPDKEKIKADLKERIKLLEDDN